MEKLKKVLKWVGITLGVIVGIVLIIIVLMLIFPDLKILNHRFVKQSTINSEVQTVAVEDGQLYNVVANTNVFDIEITASTETGKISLSYVDQKWGFAEIRNSNLSIKEDGNTIEARMLETSGWVFGTGKLLITLPSNALYNLNLNTKSGNISINYPKLNSLTVNMNTGKLLWKAEEKVTTTTTPEPDPANPDAVVEPTTKEEIKPIEDMVIDSMYIFSKTASLDLSCYKALTVNKKMFIKAEAIDLNLSELTANIYINCTRLNLTVDKLSDSAEAQIISKSGKINIGNLTTADKATIIGESTEITINDSNSATYISTTSGNVKIINNNIHTTIETRNGNVNLTKSIDDITITTYSGNIVVSEYTKTSIITTDTGTINMHDKGEDDGSQYTAIKQRTGTINFVTENNRVSINSTNGSSIRLVVRNMPLNDTIKHTILNQNGTSQISILAGDNPFRVRAVGNVSGELASNVMMTSNTEYVNYIPANYSGTAPEQASLNVEGGAIHFTALYE